MKESAAVGVTRICTAFFLLPTQFHGVPHFSHLVEKVRDGAKGVFPGHSGTRKTHDVLSFLTLDGFVAMNRAIGAGGLVRAVRAFLEAFACVTHQFTAIRAQTVCISAVMMVTINPGHADQRFMFTLQPAFKLAHG